MCALPVSVSVWLAAFTAMQTMTHEQEADVDTLTLRMCKDHIKTAIPDGEEACEVYASFIQDTVDDAVQSLKFQQQTTRQAAHDSSRANDHERQTCLDRGLNDPFETFDLALSDPDRPVGEAALKKSKRSMSGSTLTSAANKRSCAAALLGLRAGRGDCAATSKCVTEHTAVDTPSSRDSAIEQASGRHADNAPSSKHAANDERYLSPHGQGRTRHARS